MGFLSIFSVDEDKNKGFQWKKKTESAGGGNRRLTSVSHSEMNLSHLRYLNFIRYRQSQSPLY